MPVLLLLVCDFIYLYTIFLLTKCYLTAILWFELFICLSFSFTCSSPIWSRPLSGLSSVWTIWRRDSRSLASDLALLLKTFGDSWTTPGELFIFVTLSLIPLLSFTDAEWNAWSKSSGLMKLSSYSSRSWSSNSKVGSSWCDYFSPTGFDFFIYESIISRLSYDKSI